MNKRTTYIIIGSLTLILILILILIKSVIQNNTKINSDTNSTTSQTDLDTNNMDSNSFNTDYSNDTTSNKIRVYIQQNNNCFTLVIKDNSSNIGGFSLEVPEYINNISIKSSEQTKLIKTTHSIEGLILNQTQPYNLGEICINRDINSKDLFNAQNLKFFEVQTGRPVDIVIE